MMIGLSFIPLLILGSATILSDLRIMTTITGDISDISNQTIDVSVSALNDLGKKLIQQQSKAAAQEIGLYIVAHPEKTIKDLQQDLEFQRLASQSVGETGYLGVHERNTLIQRFYPNPARLNRNFEDVRESLPDFYSQILVAQRKGEAGGFYTWKEVDGSTKQKYQYISSTNVTTADGVMLQVGATTYIDEFSAPAHTTLTAISKKNQDLIDSVNLSFYRLVLLLILLIVITVVVILIVGYLFASSISRPLLALSRSAEQIGSGNLHVLIPESDRSDEIGVLSRAFLQMRNDLVGLYQRLEDQIDELSRMQKEISISEEKYRTIFQHGGNPIILAERDMTITLVNQKFQDLWGYSFEEIEGKKKWIDFVAGEDNRDRMVHYNQIRRDRPDEVPWEYEFQLVTSDGEIRDVIVKITLMPASEQFLASFMDITEVRRNQNELLIKNDELNASYEELASTEEELRYQYTLLKEKEHQLEESELRYKNVIEDQTEFICRSLVDGTILFVNGALCRYFELSSDEIIGQKDILIIAEEDKEKCVDYFSSFSPENPVNTHEVRIVLRTGEIRWHQWTDRAIFDENGIIIEYQSVGCDISERKHIEQEKEKALFQIERNLAELSILNDGIRNPLTIIQTVAEGDVVDSEIIIAQVERIDNLIKTLDRRWVENEKILSYLQKHHKIGLK
jgi:PAS domain S-box-containing protein